MILPEEASDAAGLRYVTDDVAGIRRRRCGRGFVYHNGDGRRITESGVLAQIRSLSVPPAWTDVWICPQANGHLQATGRDARGRKQYRYHPRWREARDEAKFQHAAEFGEALSAIRSRVRNDLRHEGLPREKVLATVVALLDTTLIRVGNDEYARENGSFGLTTLRGRHVDVIGSLVRFDFKGKAGVRHEVTVKDRRLAAVVRRCQDIPGYELFRYVENGEEPRSIDSSDVNDYLRDISGTDFSAKDFRTWHGTVLAVSALQQVDIPLSHAKRKREVIRALHTVAQRLGNSPAICRKCYIHPGVLDAYLEADPIWRLLQTPRIGRPGLGREETAVLRFLKHTGRIGSHAA